MEDQNENAFFVEFGGKVLQMGKKKGAGQTQRKRRKPTGGEGSSQAHPAVKKASKSPICTRCNQLGHRKSNKNCPLAGPAAVGVVKEQLHGFDITLL